MPILHGFSLILNFRDPVKHRIGPLLQTPFQLFIQIQVFLVQKGLCLIRVKLIGPTSEHLKRLVAI